MFFKLLLSRYTYSSIIRYRMYLQNYTYYIKYLFLKFINYNPINTFISHCIQNFYWKHPLKKPLSNLPINLIWTLDQFHTIEKFIFTKISKNHERKNLEDAKRNGKNHINSTIYPRPASSEASIPSGGLRYDLTRSSQYLLTALITFNNRKQHEKYLSIYKYHLAIA